MKCPKASAPGICKYHLCIVKNYQRLSHLVPLDVRNSIWWQHNVHDIIDESILEYSISHGGGAEAGAGVDLDQPWLEIVVDDNIVSIALVTMSIRDHDRGHCLQTVHNQPVDLIEQLVTRNLSTRHLKIQTKIVYRQLSSVNAEVSKAL